MEELFHYCGGARGDNARRLPPPLSAWTYEHTMDKVNPIQIKLTLKPLLARDCYKLIKRFIRFKKELDTIINDYKRTGTITGIYVDK